VLGDAFEDVAQIRLGVDAVDLGGADQALDVGSTLSTGVVSGKQIALADMRSFPRKFMIWANRVLPTYIDASDYKLAARQAVRWTPIQVGDTH